MTSTARDHRRRFELMGERTWETQVESFAHDDAVAHLEQRAAAAIAILREEFHPNFLERPPAGDWRLGAFRDFAPCSRKVVVWLGEAIGRVRSVRGWNKFRRGISSPGTNDTIGEALSVIQVADKLLRSGFDIEFEVPVTTETHHPVPDIRACLGSEIVFIEVAILGFGDGHERRERVTHAVTFAASGAPFGCSKLKRLLDDDELETLVAEIQRGVATVRGGSGFWTLDDDRIAIALGGKERIASWASERGLSLLFGASTFHGLDLDDREQFRIFPKLWAEHEQLPVSVPGFVAIVERRHVGPFLSPELALLAQRMVLASFPHVIGSSVLWRWAGGEVQAPRDAEGGTYSVAVDEFKNTEAQTLSLNASPSFAASDQLLKKLRSAFLDVEPLG